MTRANLLRKRWIGGEWQKTRSGRDPVLLHNYGAVMERQAGIENREQKVSRNMCFQPDTALNKSPQANITLENDQRAGLAAGKALDCQQNLIDRLRRTAPAQSEPAFAAQTRQRAPDLRLEQHDHREADVRKDQSQQGAQSDQKS